MWKREGDSQAIDRQAAPGTVAAGGEPSNFLAQGTQLRTSIGADAKVTGKLSFNAPTRIDGKLKGEVSCSDLLVIGESGTVDGNVSATELVVLGSVVGDIRGAQRVELGPKGNIEGTVESGALSVHEGGQLNGQCRVLSQRGNVHQITAKREIDD